MYEQHFGLTDRPFGAAPDPDFFFASAGHARVLGHLEYAIAHGDCLIVMTGDVGAGKTTLVLKLLRGFDPASVVSAHLVSTQLDARDLLTALSKSFGAPPLSQSSLDELRAGLQAFVQTLAAGGRTVLAIIDEAQNLRPDALAQLAELAKPPGGPLRILLVGQPELRRTLQLHLPDWPVSLSCHIGPLLEAETASYIEYRLGRVHWNRGPLLGPEAHALIHRVTGGVPRRINRLCDRLLLAASLRGDDTIPTELVTRTAAELQAELGSPRLPPTAPREASVELATAAGRVRGGARRRPPHADDAAIPVLAAAVDEVPFPLVTSKEPAPPERLPEWATSSLDAVIPAETGGPTWQRDESSADTFRGFGSATLTRSVFAIVAVAGVIALSVWGYRAAQQPAATLAERTIAIPPPAVPTAAPPTPSGAGTDKPIESPPRPAESAAIATESAPIDINPAAGPPRVTPRQAPRAAQAGAPGAPPARPNRAAAVAEPAPVAAPCTAAVAALGLCTTPLTEGRQ